MSDQTFEALTAAVQAHIADEHPGQFVGDWILASQVTSFNARPAAAEYRNDYPPMAPHAVLGLLNIAGNLIDQEDEDL